MSHSACASFRLTGQQSSVRRLQQQSTAVCATPAPLRSHRSRSGRAARLLSVAAASSTAVGSETTGNVDREKCKNSGLERVAFRSEGWNYWTWRGHKVHYIQEGDSGTPIVLVHGFGAHAYHWRYQFPELSKKHRVYALCLLGYGWSAKPAVPYSSEYWGDQVADFIREVVGEPAMLVGNSIGAIACLSAAYRDPEMTTGLALLNAAGRFEDASAPQPAAVASSSADNEQEDTSIGAKLNELFRRVVAQFIFLTTKYRIGQILEQVYVDKKKVDPELIRSIYQPACEPDAAEARARLLVQWRNPPAQQAFFQISGSGGRSKRSLNTLLAKLRDHGPKPVVLVWGMKDPWMQPQKAKQILSLYPEAELVEVAEGGHCPHDDDPATVNAALLRWAAGLQA